MDNRSIRTPAGRAPGRLIALVLSVAALVWGAWTLGPAWWYEIELGRADREMAEGRYEGAMGRLEWLATRRPDSGAVQYALGASAANLGHVDTALAAWGRVPSRSPLASRAALDRARLALDHGRLSVAEESLAPLLAEPGEVGEEAVRLADQVDLYTGRIHAIVRRIEGRRPSSTDHPVLLRLHWQLGTQPFPLKEVREALDRMAREAPEDDRIWLGRANLATRTGDWDVADDWLRRCEARRPDDRDVRRARLAWALAAGRPDAAVEAASQLPASALSAAERAEMIARLAELRGDAEARRAAWERLVALRPGDPSASGRLAELSALDGDRERASELRRLKAKVDRAVDDYRMLMGSVAADDPSRAAELARAAEGLGRKFEARGWWEIRQRRVPDDREAHEALARLDADPKDNEAGGSRMLADLIPPSLAASTGPAVATMGGLRVPIFQDDAEAAGLRFVYQNDATPRCRFPETMGGGVALVDYDGDGWLDVYCVQGGHLPDVLPPPPAPQGDRLFRNQGDGTFKDVTDSSGLAALPGGYGHGATVGDYDNDGHPDLFITRWRAYVLYRNRGDGTFEDATARAGLGGDRDWPTSSAFADLDGDGDLDLYVCHYAAWDPARTPPCPHPTDPGRHGYCVPRSIPALPDHVFRNDGGRFVDVSDESGLTSADHDGRGLGVVAAHLDDDDRSDLFIADDMTANLLLVNQGGFRFEESAAMAGVATNASGGYLAGMGIACGDLDGDGRSDLAVTNFYGESTTFYQNLGGGQFADRSSAVNLSATTRHVLGFGVAFVDANNDGRLDVVQANGHVNDYRPSISMAMPAQLLLGGADGRLEDVSARAGACWSVLRLGRGLAAGDLDNDGRPDLLIVSSGQPMAFLHNRGPSGHFVTIVLEGTPPGSNRDAIGARVIVTAGGRRHFAQRIGGGSFLSTGDPRLHFGLGAATRIESIEVRWPSGRLDRFNDLAADAAYRLREGHYLNRYPLPGWETGR